MSRVRTIPVRVKVFTADFVFSGMIHTKPGGYKERVSDILNDPSVRFLVLTDVTFKPVAEDDEPARHSSTVLLKIDEIRFIIPFEGKGESGQGPGAGR